MEEAGAESLKRRNVLSKWAKVNRVSESNLYNTALKKLTYDLHKHKFYSTNNLNGVNYPVRGKNPIEHPLPDKDEGIRLVNLISYIYEISDEELAKMIMQVNNRSINNLFQTIRRRISILERPLSTARGDGKSYIYANCNPKYAQQILTIFRTFYNFCWTAKLLGEELTPAQRLGLTDKVFNCKNIIYFR